LAFRFKINVNNSTMKLNISLAFILFSLNLTKVVAGETAGQFSETFNTPNHIQDHGVPFFNLDLGDRDKMLGKIQKNLEKEYHSLLTNSLQASVSRSNAMKVNNAPISITIPEVKQGIIENTTSESDRQLVSVSKQLLENFKIDEPTVLVQKQEKLLPMNIEEISLSEKDIEFGNSHLPDLNNEKATMGHRLFNTSIHTIKSVSSVSSLKSEPKSIKSNIPIIANSQKQTSNATKTTPSKVEQQPSGHPRIIQPKRRQLTQPKIIANHVQQHNLASPFSRSARPTLKLRSAHAPVKNSSKAMWTTNLDKSIPLPKNDHKPKRLFSRYHKSTDNGLINTPLSSTAIKAKMISLREKNEKREHSNEDSNRRKQTGSDNILKTEGLEMITVQKITGQPIDTTKPEDNNTSQTNPQEQKHAVINVINVKNEGGSSTESEEQAKQESTQIVNALVDEKSLLKDSEVNVRKTDKSYNVVVDENPNVAPMEQDDTQAPIATSKLGMSISNLKEEEKREKQQAEKEKNAKELKKRSAEEKDNSFCENFEDKLALSLSIILALVSLITI
jgi:hypothetical protein